MMEATLCYCVTVLCYYARYVTVVYQWKQEFVAMTILRF